MLDCLQANEVQRDDEEEDPSLKKELSKWTRAMEIFNKESSSKARHDPPPGDPRSPFIPPFAPCSPRFCHFICCVGAYNTSFPRIVRDNARSEMFDENCVR